MNSVKMDVKQVTMDDLESLIALRIKAMQPSLEAIDRFDPLRARERFVKGFDAKLCSKVLVGNKLAGFYVLIDREDHLWLDHLYIDPSFQGTGLGSAILKNVQIIATNSNLVLRLGALKESRANQFYLSHGFVCIAKEQWDNIYQWSHLR